MMPNDLMPDFDPGWLVQAPHAHHGFRSMKGVCRGRDGIHISVTSTRLGTLVSPERVLRDYDHGKIGLGTFVQAPSTYEICLIEISQGVAA